MVRLWGMRSLALVTVVPALASAAVACAPKPSDSKTGIVVPPVVVETAAPKRESAVDQATLADDQRYEIAIASVKKRLETKQVEDMEARREAPFIVVADGGEQALERGMSTVRWAADKLEAEFFDTRPANILPVFLFQDSSSYRDNVVKLTGEYPSTPYGFYSRTHGGLFMNIATGGGTLVHEIVHPYVEADFPNAPAWLNEGLGSLFEQSAERDGRIVGLTNWRLAGLQKAIAKGQVPTFKKLTHLGDNEFYGDESGVNYASARYLLYYLQEHGKLREFYRSFRAAREEDPSGYTTLTATLASLGEDDVTAFEAKWRAYVSHLSFP